MIWGASSRLRIAEDADFEALETSESGCRGVTECAIRSSGLAGVVWRSSSDSAAKAVSTGLLPAVSRLAVEVDWSSSVGLGLF